MSTPRMEKKRTCSSSCGWSNTGLNMFKSLILIATTIPTINVHALHMQIQHTFPSHNNDKPAADPMRRSIIASPVAAASGAASLSFPHSSLATDTDLVTVSSSVRLPGSNNVFPLTSFGLQIYDNDTAFKLTMIALEAGYRNFFASVLAGNQKGFAKAIQKSNIPRDEIYICGSVLSNRASGNEAAYQKTKKGCMENLKEFAYGDIQYLDMIMLDYPGPDADSIRGQWRAFEEFKEQGYVQDLAVSNFGPAQMDAILVNSNGYKATTKPCVNQLPFSLGNHPKNILEFNKERGVLVQSWSPLSRVLNNPALRPILSSVGNKYNKSMAQVALRWIVQSGAGFSTQSNKKQHFEEDINIFDFELTKDEMDLLSGAI